MSSLSARVEHCLVVLILRNLELLLRFLENPSVKIERKREQSVQTEGNGKTNGRTERNHERTVKLKETSKMNGFSCKILEKPLQNSLLSLQQPAMGQTF